MKTHLFTALLAIVAIGGGLTSANADIFYAEGSDQGITCDFGSATCAEQFIPTENIYKVSATEGQESENLVSRLELEDYQFTQD